MHVHLSEEPSTWSPGNYCWKTVAISYVVGDKRVQVWPAVYSQELDNIQYSEGGKRGLKRRYSVGCFPPPQVPQQGGQNAT
jgi:hypothetical protein